MIIFLLKSLAKKDVADFRDEYELPPVPKIELTNPTNVLENAMEYSRD